MRLTSYNIALVRLKAGCCLSDMVGRMWQYMEEGDTENAQCVREKALILSGLIKTLCRWRPTIAEGYRRSATFTIDSGNYPIPFIAGQITINGIPVSKTSFMVLSGGNDDVFNGFAESVNCNTSSSDDIIQASASLLSGDITINAVYEGSLSPLDSITATGIIDAPGVTVSATTTEEVPFLGAVPKCLTDSQVLSIIGKIDELCGCNC